MINKFAQNPQFERSFADLAYATLQDEAPGLLDYMVGFQVIEKDEDESHAVGVFGFRVGEQWFYVPVFFLNGELKHSGLYIKEQDTFVPLQENWVNYLINRKPVRLGEASTYDTSDLNLIGPDFQVFSNSPFKNSFRKLSAAEYDKDHADELYGYWRTGARFDLRPALRCFEVDVNSPVFKTAAEHMSLPAVVKQLGAKAKSALLRMVQVTPGIKEAVNKFYTDKELGIDSSLQPIAIKPITKAALDKANISRKEFNWYVRRAADGKKPSPAVRRVLKQAGVTSMDDIQSVLPQLLSDSELEPEAVETSNELRITVITPDDMPHDTTEEEKTEVLTDGFAVRDDRPEEEQPEVYDGADLPGLSCVCTTGLYAVLTKDRAFRDMLLIQEPVNIGRGTDRDTLIIDCTSRSWDMLDVVDGFYAMNDGPGQDAWHSYYQNLAGVESLQKGETYCVIGPDGLGSVPFRVVSRTGDDLLVVKLKGGGEGTLMIDDKSPVMRGIGPMLVVPSDYKVVNLSAQRGLSQQPGSASDARLFVYKSSGVRNVSLWSDGARYQIEHNETIGSPLSNNEAALKLVKSFELTKSAAHKMLSSAEQRGVNEFIVKSSRPRVEDPSFAFHPDMGQLDNSRSYDSEIDTMTQGPVSSTQTANNQYAMNAEKYNPMLTDPQLQTAVTNAAGKDQKEVFDTGILSSLVQMLDVDSVVDKYLGDLIVGEDRLGRILFLSYWHRDKFIERYGETELKELEDTLKNAFKGVGDLILFLKKKSIEPGANTIGADTELG